MPTKLVYIFGGKKADGDASQRNLLGGKGANLAEMVKLGLPVPAGFTITTEMCAAYYANNHTHSTQLKKEVEKALKFVEKQMGGVFGDPQNPLLVSCRSGARASMPGMMDTILNIGLNDQTVQGLIAKTDNPRFAYDSYRRFISMYGNVVIGLGPTSEKAEDPFEAILGKLKKKNSYTSDTEMTAEDLKNLVAEYKAMIKKTLGASFPEDPLDQLWGAISAVFASWMNPRAMAYRNIHALPHDWGTAVTVQAMVFGNMGDDSATGVAFSRDPSTGENYFYGEYLVNAQGEDVVAGTRTPLPLNRSKPLPAGCNSTLADDMPKIYKELDGVRRTLELHYKDMQDIEFTIQQGKLWMLQCRDGKRTAQAALRIAVDMVKEKLLTEEEALLRIKPEQLNQMLLPSVDLSAKRHVIAKGLPASPGAAVGRVVFSATEAVEWAQKSEPVILVRLETSPEDIQGMFKAEGILTTRGGMTSHAAVVARGMGKTCVAGAAEVNVDYEAEAFSTLSGAYVKKGDWISLDGSRGEVILGKVSTLKGAVTDQFATFMKWVKKYQAIEVRANADTPADSALARSLGAVGIGLCRTEHMFFEEDRIVAVREMIVAQDEEGRKKALSKLLPMQRADFYGIFKAMDGLPVTIRTLDPPLHEFLPHEDSKMADLAKATGNTLAQIKSQVQSLAELNPMLGHRGCRLGIVHPEITAMQARAVFEAACRATAENIKVLPEIMIPLVGHEKEFQLQKEIVDRVAKEVMAETKIKLNYQVGVMIELPRACLVADRIARAGAAFFSFGTNDLTQTVYGLSRDDSGNFLPNYLSMGIWEQDPFVSLDPDSTCVMIKMGMEKGRSVNGQLKIGICGEHGGDPASVRFCATAGMNYVSCSPFRVPVARLAAAQTAILGKKA